MKFEKKNPQRLETESMELKEVDEYDSERKIDYKRDFFKIRTNYNQSHLSPNNKQMYSNTGDKDIPDVDVEDKKYFPVIREIKPELSLEKNFISPQDFVPFSNSNEVWSRGCLSILAQIRAAKGILVNKSEKYRLRHLDFRDMDMINDRASSHKAFYQMGILNKKPAAWELWFLSFRRSQNRVMRRLQFILKLKEFIDGLILRPDSWKKLVWNFFIFTVLFINFYYSSCVIVFGQKFTSSLTQDVIISLEYIPVAMCLLDMLINMSTSFYKNGLLLFDRREIIKNYFKGEFMIDVIIIISMIRVDSFQESLKLSNKKEAFLTLTHLLLKIVITAHICGCAFLFVTKYEGDEQITWLKKNGINDQVWFVQYITSLYWAVVTMITLGYGDIVPITFQQRITVIVISFIACGMFAYSFNQIGLIFQTINESRARLKQQLNQISGYMDRRLVTYDLQMKVNRYYEYVLNNSDDVEANDKLLKLLNPDLKRELSMDIYGRLLKRTQPFYLNFSSGVLKNLALFIREISYTPETLILQRQKENDKFYFIIQGQIESYYVSSTNGRKLISVLRSGDFFGRESFFTDVQENYNYVSKSLVTMAYLERKDFMTVLQQYPSQYQQFCEKRDQFLLLGGQGLDLQCEICRQFRHIPQECPRLTFRCNQLRIIKENTHSTSNQQRDTKYNRLRNDKFNCRTNLQRIHVDAIQILSDLKYYNDSALLEAKIQSIRQSFSENSNFLEYGPKPLEDSTQLDPSQSRNSLNSTLHAIDDEIDVPDFQRESGLTRNQKGSITLKRQNFFRLGNINLLQKSSPYNEFQTADSSTTTNIFISDKQILKQQISSSPQNISSNPPKQVKFQEEVKSNQQRQLLDVPQSPLIQQIGESKSDDEINSVQDPVIQLQDSKSNFNERITYPRDKTLINQKRLTVKMQSAIDFFELDDDQRGDELIHEDEIDLKINHKFQIKDSIIGTETIKSFDNYYMNFNFDNVQKSSQKQPLRLLAMNLDQHLQKPSGNNQISVRMIKTIYDNNKNN